MKRTTAAASLTGAIPGAGLLLSACAGPQSALDAAGREAEEISVLFWWMASGAAVIWLAVVGIAVYAIRLRPEEHGDRFSRALIVGGGAVFPTVVLGALLLYALSMMPGMREAGTSDFTVEVSGERWWWRVRYLPEAGEAVELANEVRLPVGERVEFRLVSPDVIHSFWIPPLGGKMDMIPGRTNRLVLEPTRTGTFRGACAEYCGASHALMAFDVVVMERAEFDVWLGEQRSSASSPSDAVASAGQRIFLESGCGACHAVRGTEADGAVGPDLTHVGSRLSLAAGTLDNELADFRRFIAASRDVKPEAHMPPFGMLPDEELDAMAAYLESLQ